MNNPTVVIASVPWVDTDSLLMAPGVLKSCLSKYQINSVAIDLSQEIRKKVNSSSNKKELIEFFLTQQVVPHASDEIYNLFNYMATRILEFHPEWVCLSLLTYGSQISGRWLSYLLKSKQPTIKIVLGGPGCYNGLKSLDDYAHKLQRNGVIDYFISGDGEHSLPKLILGNTTYPGINQSTWKEVENLDSLPLPDYSDYNFDLYKSKSVGIWGSRGCVRQCTFCDIHEHWTKFQWRSAKNIFAEMVDQNKKYGINVFKFADSLINGNQKEYRELIKLLADYNQNRSKQDRIKWTSFFIFRPKTQMSEEDWRLTAESGAMMLSVGVESFVDHIRDHIKKKFNNKDLDYNLQMAQKYSVLCTLLMIVGYVTETEADHQEQLEWIRNNKHFAGNPVKFVQVGSTLAILPGTWLDAQKENLGVEVSGEVFQNWTRDSTGSTPQVRMRWHQEMINELTKNNFTPVFTEDNHLLIESYLGNNNG